MDDRLTVRESAAEVSPDSGTASGISELSAQIWDSMKSKAHSISNQVNEWRDIYSDSTIGKAAKSAGELFIDAHMATADYVMDSKVRTEINNDIYQTASDVGKGIVDGRDFVAGRIKDYTVDSSIGRTINSWNDSKKELEWVKQVNSFIQRGGQFAKDLL